MSTPFPNDIRDNKHTENMNGFIYWELVIVLLVTLFTLFYCFTDLFHSIDTAFENHHSPVTPLMTDKERKPEAAFVNPSVHGTSISKTSNNVLFPQASPASAPASIKANVDKSALATAKKPEDNLEQVGPSAHPPIASVQTELQVKAETRPTKVAVEHVDKATKPVIAIKKTKKPVLKSGSYTLLIGEFPDGKETEGISTRLKKFGVSPVHVDHVKKLHPMNRLFLANFDDHETADKELQKVRQQAPGAFITRENEKFSVYAGSFLNNKKAVAEQKRLALENIKLIIQTTQVSVSLTRVTAGSFPDGGAATMKARLLQKQGFHVKAIKAE